MNKLSILNIIHDTTVDGPGFRTAIYSAGCMHQCRGCHNPESWNIANGSYYSVKDLLKVIEDDEFANVTFSGGDPLMQIDGFTELARQIKDTTKKSIWCYTGFRYEQIVQSKRLSSILPFLDVLIDGRYVKNLRNEDLQFRGSSNQRIIDVQKSLQCDEIVLWGNEEVFTPSHSYHSRMQY